jgi:hypothetical protein
MDDLCSCHGLLNGFVTANPAASKLTVDFLKKVGNGKAPLRDAVDLISGLMWLPHHTLPPSILALVESLGCQLDDEREENHIKSCAERTVMRWVERQHWRKLLPKVHMPGTQLTLSALLCVMFALQATSAATKPHSQEVQAGTAWPTSSP